MTCHYTFVFRLHSIFVLVPNHTWDRPWIQHYIILSVLCKEVLQVSWLWGFCWSRTKFLKQRKRSELTQSRKPTPPHIFPTLWLHWLWLRIFFVVSRGIAGKRFWFYYWFRFRLGWFTWLLRFKPCNPVCQFGAQFIRYISIGCAFVSMKVIFNHTFPLSCLFQLDCLYLCRYLCLWILTSLISIQSWGLGWRGSLQRLCSHLKLRRGNSRHISAAMEICNKTVMWFLCNTVSWGRWRGGGGGGVWGRVGRLPVNCPDQYYWSCTPKHIFLFNFSKCRNKQPKLGTPEWTWLDTHQVNYFDS